MKLDLELQMIPVSLILVKLIRIMSEYFTPSLLCVISLSSVLCSVFMISCYFPGYSLLESIQYKDLNNYDCINPLIGVETMITARKHK